MLNAPVAFRARNVRAGDQLELSIEQGLTPIVSRFGPDGNTRLVHLVLDNGDIVSTDPDSFVWIVR
jgi:hypothetical protein